LKASFVIEEEGFDAVDEATLEARLQDFARYVKVNSSFLQGGSN
jgi:hypothetical protein